MEPAPAPYDQLVALSEWARYASNPGQENLKLVLAAASKIDARSAVPRALALLFTSSQHWRVAQHLALELMEQHADATLAEYYAAKAMELSGDDPFARLTLARCFWLQHFPEVVLSQLAIVEKALAQINAERRPAVEHEIADLYSNAYCYGNRVDLAEPHISRLLQSGQPIRGQTLLQIFAATFDHSRQDLALRVAKILETAIDTLGRRDQTRVRSVLSRAQEAT